jgi:DNA-binding NtrC family response regulator
MIILLAQSRFPADQVAEALRAEGVTSAHFSWEHTVRELRLPKGLDQAVLIAEEPKIIGIGERTKEVRSMVGEQPHLLVCAQAITDRDRRTLTKFGANTIVTPRTFSVEHVTERITAELILQGNEPVTSFGSLYGGTKVMRQLYSDIETLAGLNDPVLILGETGTGKDLIARELHRCGRRSGPFLKLNCAEFRPELLRTELFGHAKGAFTGADREKEGLLAAAGEGTLFLDEIGELDLQAQAMLLQALEDRTFRPVGSNKMEHFEARLVLATHRNLEQMVEQGRFRQDFFARVYDFILLAPPLRQRRADIPILVQRFLDQFNLEYPDRKARITTEAMDCLFSSEWPENIRQLLKVIRKAAVFRNPDGTISPAYLQSQVDLTMQQRPEQEVVNSTSFDPEKDTIHDAIHRLQKAYLKALLERTNGNKEEAIKKSGLGRSRFYTLLKELEIK